MYYRFKYDFKELGRVILLAAFTTFQLSQHLTAEKLIEESDENLLNKTEFKIIKPFKNQNTNEKKKRYSFLICFSIPLTFS